MKELSKIKIVVKALKCNKCGDIIYSRAIHDSRFCTCEGCFVDGGFDYFKAGGKLFHDAKVLVISLNVDEKTLYQDWNLRTDRFGLIKKSNDLSNCGVIKINLVRKEL